MAAPGLESDLGALAGAYVLILAASGPLIARVMNPLVRHRLESRGRERPLPR